jgi:hypothetical protein
LNAEHSYEEGLIEGRMQAMERIMEHHEQKMREIDSRTRMMERVLWGVLGAIALMQLLPMFREMMK